MKCPLLLVQINLIKTVLFNAANLKEALTRLDELGIVYRACSFTDNGYHVTGHDVTFWPAQSLRCPLAVCINGNLFDYDDRRSFLAGQCETVEPVPAASPDITGQRPITCQHCGKSDFDDSTGCKSPVVFSPAVGDFICGFIPEQSTVSVDKNRRTWLIKPYLKEATLRTVIRIERTLKRSQAKGLSS